MRDRRADPAAAGTGWTRRALSAATLLVVSAVLWLWGAGLAGATSLGGDQGAGAGSGPIATTPPAGSPPLAATGLNLAVPVTIGLVTLILGMGLVCWAFLRGSRTRRRS